MNLNLPKQIILFALLLLPLLSFGQVVELYTFQDAAVTYDFISRPNGPSTVGADPADNGTFDLSPNTATTSNFDYIMTYTPNPGFIGIDTFKVRRWDNFSVVTMRFMVHVSATSLKANHDYTTVRSGEAVIINVLANDISSNGIKILQAVPAINHGQADFDAATGLITFTPDADYTGLAHFNYNICNGAGNCTEGTVSISVVPEAATTETENILVFTKKNALQFIMVPPSYTLTQLPTSGVFDGGADVPTYTPGYNFVGNDVIRFNDGNHDLVFDIRVLDIESNVFAHDDQFFTTTGTTVEIDPFLNDLSENSSTSGCTGLDTPPEHGTLNGLFEYTPDAGFVGVDQFIYRSKANGCTGQTEYATVYIFVSNFEPAETSFEMATPKETPIIIGYNVPSTTFSFQITSQGTLGETLFLQGVVDTIINGVPIQGNNILIYIPNTGVTTGLDQIEITYCLADPNPDNTDCLVSKQVKIWMSILDVGTGDAPVCVGDCVWAGDTNADGIVNMTDLLPIGLNMGKIGTERPNATSEYWYGQYAEDWGNLFGGQSTINVKHIDADGNSMVTAADTTAIRSFYGNTHNMVPGVMPYAPFEFIIEGPLFVEPGDLVSFSIKIGMPDAPAEDVYGLVFPFPYNPDAIDPESIDIHWDNDNFMAYDSPVLFMDHNNFEGQFEAGYTRTSGLRANGYGELGTLDLIIEDINGFRPDQDELLLTIGGGVGSAMNSQGQMQAVRVRGYELPVRFKEEAAAGAVVFAPEQLKVAPNPTSDLLTVHLNGQQEFEQLVLRTLTGQVVKNYEGLRTNDFTLSLKGLPAGIYVLSVANGDGVINRKVEVF